MHLAIRPSRFFTALNLLVHSLALLAVLINSLYSPEVASLLTFLIVLSAIRQRRFLVSRKLLVSGDQWFIDGGRAEQLLSPVFTGKWFVVLRLSASGFVVIGSDSVSASEFRRLTVLLRIRASRMMAA